jgi:hypothetical protein
MTVIMNTKVINSRQNAVNVWKSISARDQYETEYKQQIREADNDKKFVIFLELQIVICI